MPSLRLSGANAGVALAGLATAIAITVAACGPASSGPTAGAPVTNPPSTQVPVATGPASTDPFGLPSFALPSFALPSFSRDEDLEALLPDELDGQPLQKISMTGDSFIGAGGTGSEELDAVLRAAGKTPADLSVAFAGTETVTLIAYRIQGVPAETFFESFLAAAQADSEVSVSTVSLGGKSVRKLVSTDAEVGTVYVYTKDDVLYLVGGEAVPDDLLEEAFSKLP
jgi:hypothetical protein